jgi:CPA2 family monovalent cation:H+ antiporter-2
MHSATFLQDLAVVMIVAGMVTLIFHRLKQPVVLGYIIAGVITGPYTPPFPLIHEKETIDTLAELGVILLMFALGLEFNLRKLQQVGTSAFIAAFLEILLMVWIGYEIGRLFDWSTMDSIFLGAILSISSTTIMVKTLGELGKTKERFAQLMIGVLIIEDILGIAMIALLSGIAMTGGLSVGEVGVTLGKLGLFLTVVLVAGLIAVPRLIGYVARFKSNEMLLITVLALCFGVSLLATRFQYSVALGAFLIGAIIAEAREIHRIEQLIEPVRDMFSAIFFVAIGLLIDPKMLREHWLPILVITVAVVVGKVVSCAFGAFAGGNDTRTSLRVGMGLAQIGEFSFIIAALGLSLKVTSPFLYPIAVAVSALTTLLTPYLIKSADGLVGWFDRVAPRSVLSTLDLYTNWVRQLAQRESSMGTKLLWRWLAQIALNVLLITAAFIAAAFLDQRRPAWLNNLKLDEEWLKAALWLAAAIVSLPMFIAASRKLQAVGLLTAELKVKESAANERTAAIAQVIIPFAGTVILGLYVLVFSSALLPSLRVLVLVLVVAGIMSWLLRRWFIRMYSKAQAALQETFAQPPGPRPAPAPAATTLLREAHLEIIPIGRDSSAAGKLIRELELRTRTGASIIGIDRNRSNLINPGPDEEVQAGDQILLLGTSPQIRSAKSYFGGENQ